MKTTRTGRRLTAVRGSMVPPEPTHKDPYAQVKWAFERRANVQVVKSDDGKENYKTACGFLIKHLEAIRGHKPYYIADEWHEFSLLELRDSILERRDAGELRQRSHSLTGIFSAMRQAFDNAAKLGVLRTRTIQMISVGAPAAETDGHSAYTDFELKQVVDALESELAFAEAASKPPPMPVTAIGNDPRIRRYGATWGWKPEANMRWYFVHVLGCKPVLSFGEDKIIHKEFLRGARMWHGGLHALYRRWNVSALVDDSIIMPLVTWMNYVTGLNPSTVLAMEADSYQESHPLTGSPYLKLNKPRSGGEIEMHLPLLDGTPTVPLKGKHAVWVRRIGNSPTNTVLRS